MVGGTVVMGKHPGAGAGRPWLAWILLGYPPPRERALLERYHAPLHGE